VTTLLRRRDFLASSLALAASLKAAEPTANFPRDPRHRLSVSTYPFRAVIATPGRRQAAAGSKPGMSLAQFAATIVDSFHVYGIEPWSRHFESIEPAYLGELKSAFDKAGVRVVNIPCDVRVTLCGSAEERDSSLATWRKWVDAALQIGSPSIRVHVPKGKSADDISCAVESLKAIAGYGAEKNIVINLENDNPDSEDPARVLKVIETVNSPYLRSLPDFCNSMQIHDDPAYNARSLAALFPHAFNISHVKDVEIVDGKSLRIDVDAIFAIARKAKYHGYFSMETEGSLDPYDGSKQLIAAAVKNLS
jgi:sugar phosphate isomerase/epimerase